MELLFIVSSRTLPDVRVKELEAKYGVNLSYVDKPAKLKTITAGEIWSEVFQRTTSRPDQLEQAKAFTAIANPSHVFKDLKVKRDLKANLYLVYADIQRLRPLENGYFGIRGSGVEIDGVRHFNNVISIDWVENTI